MPQLTSPLFALRILVLSALVASAAHADVFTAINYGAADANEQIAFDSINDFRADPRNGLYKAFQGLGYSGTKVQFDSILSGQTSHTSGWWASNFGNNLVTGSMDFFQTVPSTVKSQFDSLPSAGSLSPFLWSDNIGWSAHQYATWVENDAGMTANPHAIPGAPGLGGRFTNAGVNWLSAGENIAADWLLSPDLMHAGFAIDWGVGTDGIQDPPGHRNSMLSSDFTHAGIGIVDGGWTPGDVTQVQHLARTFSMDDSIFFGYVTDELTGDALMGISVDLYDASNVLLGTTTTDAQGAYTIEYDGGFGSPDRVDLFAFGRTVTSTGLGSSGSNYFLDAAITAVPEPSSFFALTTFAIPVVLRRRRK
ncbi:CAP domain-containing protein [Planctomycetes bacterium TBK1r]|uniref:SCP domain-containing protein n=1 Tax=Stieleria magnilauensis TaxID=2527963 RepID=A0ABX5Y1Q7_9BACT|nr:hypothetical protein TBK1r_50210 [Planctomycetes bacterium TBK1r]